MKPKDILEHVRDVFKGFLRASAYGRVEMDVVERKAMLGVLVLSPLVGIPLVPAAISLELLPYMEEHLRLALLRASRLDDAWGLLAGRFDVE
jgi:hypothetical protein